MVTFRKSGVSLNLRRPSLPVLVREPTPTAALRGFEMRTAGPMVGGSIDEGTRLFPRLRLGKEVLLRRTAED